VELPEPRLVEGFRFVPGGHVPAGDLLGVGEEKEGPASPAVLAPYLIAETLADVTGTELTGPAADETGPGLTWAAALDQTRQAQARLPTALEWEWAARLDVIRWRDASRWEWTLSRDFGLPYDATDGRENPIARDQAREVRGGYVGPGIDEDEGDEEDAGTRPGPVCAAAPPDIVQRLWQLPRPSRRCAEAVTFRFAYRLARDATDRGPEPLPPTAKLVLQNPPDEAGVRRGDLVELRRFAQRWLATPGRPVLEVRGHSDETGSDEYNMALTQRKVDWARRALAREGVDPRRVRGRSYGEEYPGPRRSVLEKRLDNRVEVRGGSR